MDDVIAAIRVTDANGDELTLYEYQDSLQHLTTLGLSRSAGRSRFVLDTGEPVRRLDDDSFVITATGERLARVR